MKFATVLGIFVTCVGVFVAVTVGVTVALANMDWTAKCQAPTVYHGFLGGEAASLEYENGEALNASAVICDAGFHVPENASFVCDCLSDGEACSTLLDACRNNTCTQPGIQNGYIHEDSVDMWNDLTNGSAIDPNIILCNPGYERTAQTDFVCLCSDHDEPCNEISDACIYTGANLNGTTAAPSSPSPTPQTGGNALASGSSDDMPEWLLALIISLNIAACILFAVGLYVCYDNHNKRRAEAYWNLYMEHRESKTLRKDAPVAIEVGDFSIHEKERNEERNTPVLTATVDRNGTLMNEGMQDAARAEALDKAGKVKEAMSLYKSASVKLKESVSDKAADDAAYSIAIRVQKYDARVKELETIDTNNI